MFGRMKEGAGLSAGQAILTLVNQAPHPNAAKVFINWFLSRDGQINFQKALGKADEGSPDSLRIDIPKDDVDPKAAASTASNTSIPTVAGDEIDTGPRRRSARAGGEKIVRI